jgi:hypothetical protein
MAFPHVVSSCRFLMSFPQAFPDAFLRVDSVLPVTLGGVTGSSETTLGLAANGYPLWHP